MEYLYWSCLSGGILFAIVTVVFGDIISQAMDGALDFLSLESHPYLHPLTLVGGITVFGGAGILLERYGSMSTWTDILLSLVIGVFIGAGSYFFYIKPMQRTENSIAFSMNELAGTVAEVLVPIPASGYGEVLLRIGGGVTNQIAASFDGEPIGKGVKTVVVEVKDHTLYVVKLDFDRELERGYLDA